MRKVWTLLFLLVVLSHGQALAITIEYELFSFGGTQYAYEYTLTNDGSIGTGVAVEGFSIDFSPTAYLELSLAILTSPPLATEWDEIILASGIMVPATYDVYALGGGVADGTSASGFTVMFDWLGAGLPGVQSFMVYDPFTFDILHEGLTQASPEPVPEPSTLALMLLGLGGLLLQKRKTFSRQ